MDPIQPKLTQRQKVEILNDARLYWACQNMAAGYALRNDKIREMKWRREGDTLLSIAVKYYGLSKEQILELGHRYGQQANQRKPLD